MRKRLLVPIIAVTVAVSSIFAPAASANKVFKDVTTQNAYYNVIQNMSNNGIISGYDDGTFKPSQAISRKQAAALVNRAVAVPRVTAFEAPKDLSTKNAYYNDIRVLMEAGLLDLNSRGEIRPNAALTRGEMAKIIAVAFGLDTSLIHPLKGVSDKASPYVAALYNTGVTTGFADGTFGEDKSLTRAHYAVFMYRAMNPGDVEPGQGSDPQDLYGKSFVGKYEYDKIPVPTKYKGKTSREVFDIKEVEYDKYLAAMPSGSYKAIRSIDSAYTYLVIVKNLSEITGLSNEAVSKHIDEAAKTGNTVSFAGENNKNYFIMFGYKFNVMYMGEDHLK